MQQQRRQVGARDARRDRDQQPRAHPQHHCQACQCPGEGQSVAPFTAFYAGYQQQTYEQHTPCAPLQQARCLQWFGFMAQGAHRRYLPHGHERRQGKQQRDGYTYTGSVQRREPIEA